MWRQRNAFAVSWPSTEACAAFDAGPVFAGGSAIIREPEESALPQCSYCIGRRAVLVGQMD
jgi:hypothetical protein